MHQQEARTTCREDSDDTEVACCMEGLKKNLCIVAYVVDKNIFGPYDLYYLSH